MRRSFARYDLPVTTYRIAEGEVREVVNVEATNR